MRASTARPVAGLQRPRMQRCRWRSLLFWALLGLCAHAGAALVDDRVTLAGGVRVDLTFNQPGLEDGDSTRLEDRVIELIGRATSGSEIRVSMYTFRRTEIARALLRANARGVQVEVLVDDKTVSGENEVVALLTEGDEALGPLGGCEDGCFKVCRSGCHGIHINHNKFLLFSELSDGSRWVVAQTSANFTKGQNSQYNDLIVVNNDRSLYQAFVDYYDDLVTTSSWSPRYYTVKTSDSGITAYFFPRMFGPDPVVAFLDRVECGADARIRLAHSRFETFRYAVAERLAQLADEGCDVHAILRWEPNVYSPGKRILGQLDGLYTLLPYKNVWGEKLRNAIHTKLLLVKARYDGSDDPHHVVFTGSHNLSITSLHLNDEVLLRLEHPAIFEAYERFWQGIREEAEHSL